MKSETKTEAKTEAKTYVSPAETYAPYLQSYCYLSSRTLLRMLCHESVVEPTPESQRRFGAIRLLLNTQRIYKKRIARKVYVDQEL